MEWTVVVFINENVVEAVPCNWVEGNLCYWPQLYSGSKLSNAIATCEEPVLGTWELHQVRRLGSGNETSLKKAKQKAAKAEDTSDINSELESVNRTAKKTRFHNKVGRTVSLTEHNVPETDSDDSNSDPNDETIIMPTPPSIHETQKITVVARSQVQSKTLSKKAEDTKDRSLPTIISDTGICNPTMDTSQSPRTADIPRTIRTTDTPRSSRNLDMIQTTASYSKNDALQHTPQSHRKLAGERLSHVDATPANCKGTGNTLSADDFLKKQVLRQLQIISMRQQQQAEDIGLILQKLAAHEDENVIVQPDSIFNKFSFPLQTMDELINVENFLSTNANCANLVKELMAIGGSNWKTMTTRILPKLFSNKMAKMYTWVGRTGKGNFSTLRISAQIIDLYAVQRSCKCTKNDVEGHIKGWLVKATERDKKSRTDEQTL